MANFFGKPKVAAVAPVASGSRGGSIGKDEPMQEAAAPSDFERTFRPFVVKKDAELAPENWFRERRRGVVRQVIVIEDDQDQGGGSPTVEPPPPSRGGADDDEDVVMVDADAAREGMSARGTSIYTYIPSFYILITRTDRLHDALSSLPASLRPPQLSWPPRQRRGTTHRHSVRTTLQDLTEAEITGDVPLVRSLLARLRSRSTFPSKVLIFHEDARPGYYGTWTRSSRVVGARTPFARDVVGVDYGVDSGEEWEEEDEEGDVLGGNGEEDEADEADEADSDLDSWLVDDEEEGVEPGTPIDERDGFGFDVPPLPVPKRKAEERSGGEKAEGGKKRRVVVPLVPFTKGPCWETQIGECTYEPFEPYRIHVFNGAFRSSSPL